MWQKIEIIVEYAAKNSHKVIENERGSPKLNVWRGIMINRIVCPFSSMKKYHRRYKPEHVGIFVIPQ